MLCMAAAARWGANWEELDARAGFVWRGNDRIPFAELAEAAIDHSPPDPVPLRDNADNRLAGQPLPRLDAPAKIDGSAMFAGDVRFPDMVHASLVSGPWGSRLAGLDRAAASGVRGALRIYETAEWVAVTGDQLVGGAQGADRDAAALPPAPAVRHGAGHLRRARRRAGRRGRARLRGGRHRRSLPRRQPDHADL